MSAPAAPRLRAPRAVRAGEAFEVRTLVEHRMETGLRREDGRPVPRDMLASLIVTLDGETVFAADFRNGTAPNPFHVFFLKMHRSGELAATVTDEQGRSARIVQRITVA